MVPYHETTYCVLLVADVALESILEVIPVGSGHNDVFLEVLLLNSLTVLDLLEHALDEPVDCALTAEHLDGLAVLVVIAAHHLVPIAAVRMLLVGAGVRLAVAFRAP